MSRIVRGAASSGERVDERVELRAELVLAVRHDVELRAYFADLVGAGTTASARARARR